MTSDLDVIFDLPHDVLTKYDNYEGNGQSQLLQEVKNVLKERYPNARRWSGDCNRIYIIYS